MKKRNIYGVAMVSLLCSNLLFGATLSHEKITEMVSKIKQERVGVSLVTLNNTANPFILYVPPVEEKVAPTQQAKVVKKEIVYGLQAIMNHKVFINSKWYKTGDKIGEYKVGHISSSSVILKSQRGNKTLKLKKKKFINLNRGNR